MEAIAIRRPNAARRAAVRYDDVARTLVACAEIQDRTGSGARDGPLDGRAGHELLGEADALVPVPLHWRLRLEPPLHQSRGAGACHRTANRREGNIGSAAARPADPATDRPVPIAARQQRCRARSRSRRTVSPDFRAAAWSLIDDVLTSGATVDACRRALLRAKAASVDGAGVRAGCGYSQSSHIIRYFQNRARHVAVIEIYTRPGCGLVAALPNRVLTRKKAAFTETRCRYRFGARQQMWNRVGAGATFPQIFIGETHVGGCDELYALDRGGQARIR